MVCRLSLNTANLVESHCKSCHESPLSFLIMELLLLECYLRHQTRLVGQLCSRMFVNLCCPPCFFYFTAKILLLYVYAREWQRVYINPQIQNRNGVPRQFGSCLKWRSWAYKPRTEGGLVVLKMKTHTYPQKPLRNMKVVICIHQVGCPLHIWSGALLPYSTGMSFMALNSYLLSPSIVTQQSTQLNNAQL